MELSQKSADLFARFARSAEAYPDRTALVVGEREWTYRELLTRTEQIALRLLEITDAPVRVVVVGRHSFENYAAVLGALASGAAYVPVSPSVPRSRIRLLVELADADAILVDDASVAAVRAADSATTFPPIVNVSRLTEHARPQLEGPTSLDATAYLLFTSGTSGPPKGVPVSHRNVDTFLQFATERYRLGPSDRLTQNFDLTFDLSVFDLFAAWSVGAGVVAMTPRDRADPSHRLRRHGVTVWFSVPGVVRTLSDRGALSPGSMGTLRWSLFCGDVLPAASAEAWARAAPESAIENLYGPTELTIACTAHRFELARESVPSSTGLVPIGRVFPHLEHTVVDHDDIPVRSGVPGELWVRGPQMFSGYWRDADATSAAFSTPPADAATYYRTGDRVVDLGGGTLGFLGRIDEQIKFLGYRIDLREIEWNLRTLPGVSDVGIVARRSSTGEVESIESGVVASGATSHGLLQRLREVLPTPMVPSKLILVDKLPRNSNGKIDRVRLLDALAR